MDTQNACAPFARTYLAKPHAYRVIGADGWGATVRAAPVKLGECFEAIGDATYSGANITRWTLATNRAGAFRSPPQLRPMVGAAKAALLRAARSQLPAVRDDDDYLKLIHVVLNGHEFAVVQRTFDALPPLATRTAYVFSILAKDGHGRWHVAARLQKDEQHLLGTFRTARRRDYLVTAAYDPESLTFVIYEFRSGALRIAFMGGGVSC